MVWVFEGEVLDVYFQTYKSKYLSADTTELLIRSFLSNLSSAKESVFWRK